MRHSFAKFPKFFPAFATITALFIALTADACTRALYVGDGNLVITGRSMVTVAEAVDVLGKEPFQIIAPPLPDGKPLTIHLSLSDASGDSAILEYLDGKLVIHHSKAYKIMTNSPIAFIFMPAKV